MLKVWLILASISFVSPPVGTGSHHCSQSTNLKQRTQGFFIMPYRCYLLAKPAGRQKVPGP
ncbi:MAG: hypothetical protein AB1744_06890, partial [Candidatus Zixiibacteriota bacterium]